MEIKYHIDSKGEVIFSNISNEKIEELEKKNDFYNFNKDFGIKEEKKSYREGWIFLSIEDKNITRKIFNYYMDCMIAFYEPLKNNHSIVEDKYNSKIKRLKHNITNYSVSIQDELENIIDSDESSWKDSIKEIENTLQNNLTLGAKILLRIFKNIKLINAEMDVYEIMNSENPTLNTSEHNARKLVDLSIQPFFLDFLDRHVKINIENTTKKVLADFPTFSVVLGHVFDNAVKYIAQKSDLNISFSDNSENLAIIISMLSLLVLETETEEIFKEKYSGHWAEKIALSGHGIGMFYAKKLMKMNDGDINFIPGKECCKIEGIPYAENRIEIILKQKK